MPLFTSPFSSLRMALRIPFLGALVAMSLAMSFGISMPAQAKVAFYLIEDTEDPDPSLAACMAVYTNGVLIQPEKHIWLLNYEVWEIFYEQKMMFCHKHGVIFPKGERID